MSQTVGLFCYFLGVNMDPEVKTLTPFALV